MGQLSNVLDKMKAFKSLKKDNERNIYEVIETTINVLQVTQSEKFKEKKIQTQIRSKC